MDGVAARRGHGRVQHGGDGDDDVVLWCVDGVPAVDHRVVGPGSQEMV